MLSIDCLLSAPGCLKLEDYAPHSQFQQKEYISTSLSKLVSKSLEVEVNKSFATLNNLVSMKM